MFLLDAFDEVQEKYTDDVLREIEELRGIGGNKFIITTRESRKVNIPGISRFLICPIEETEIENLADLYFKNDRFRFLSEIKVKGLQNEVRNALLFTFMVLVYKQDKELPKTQNKIIQNVISKIEKWEENKGKRSTISIAWKTKEKVLSQLAYRIIGQGNRIKS